MRTSSVAPYPPTNAISRPGRPTSASSACRAPWAMPPMVDVAIWTATSFATRSTASCSTRSAASR